MNLYRVTITGADDNTKIKDLVELQKEFPFAEWGILLSKNSEGSSRFPSLRWMEELSRENLPLAGHLCGRWVRELSSGEFTFAIDRPTILNMFQRFQINFHGIPHMNDLAGIAGIVQSLPDREFIFQLDQVNDEIFKRVKAISNNASALFDTSHGDGILRASWPAPIKNASCGYAGGLSPSNLSIQLPLIAAAAGDAKIWIDVESRVRTDDEQLDINKVHQFLSIAKPYVATH